jgi:hypothetical protein
MIYNKLTLRTVKKKRIMTTKEIANELNGIEYGDIISNRILEAAKENNLIIVHGYSDDILSIHGAINDECPAYDGGSFCVENGKLSSEGHTLVTGEWCPASLNASWLVTANKPHDTFDIMEDGELFCRGIVMSIADNNEPIKGLYGKYIIEKQDGTPIEDGAKYFVLRYDKDTHAVEALKAYCASISKQNPLLANDIYNDLGLEL